MSPWWFLLSYYFREQVDRKRGGRVFIYCLASIDNKNSLWIPGTQEQNEWFPIKTNSLKTGIEISQKVTDKIIQFPQICQFPRNVKRSRRLIMWGTSSHFRKKRQMAFVPQSNYKRRGAKKTLLMEKNDKISHKFSIVKSSWKYLNLCWWWLAIFNDCKISQNLM